MTGPRYVSSIFSTVTRSTYVYSLFDPRNGGPLLYINLFSCFLTLQGAFTYDSSHNCGSSFCITTGLDLGSVFPEYKVIQKKKKSSNASVT